MIKILLDKNRDEWYNFIVKFIFGFLMILNAWYLGRMLGGKYMDDMLMGSALVVTILYVASHFVRIHVYFIMADKRTCNNIFHAYFSIQVLSATVNFVLSITTIYIWNFMTRGIEIAIIAGLCAHFCFDLLNMFIREKEIREDTMMKMNRVLSFF